MQDRPYPYYMDMAALTMDERIDLDNERHRRRKQRQSGLVRELGAFEWPEGDEEE